MRWLFIALVLVAAVWLWTAQQPDQAAPAEPIVDDSSQLGSTEPPQIAMEPLSGNSQVSPEAGIVAEPSSIQPGTETVINIGEPMDPDDPSTWPVDENTEVINIGEPIDPDDPSTWPRSDSTEVINIGEPMDPDDPSTWPVDENTEVINIGEPMDPGDPLTWAQSEGAEVINIGEPMDPDAPSTWPRDGR